MKKHRIYYLLVIPLLLIVLGQISLKPKQEAFDATISSEADGAEESLPQEVAAQEGASQEDTSQEVASQEVASQEVVPEESDELTVHFIDVGQGDSTLIVCGDEAMLIDAGDNYKGTTIQLYLKKQGVERLKYVIGTHPDADHIGGLDVILYKYDCETILMPNKENDTAAYREVCEALAEKQYQVTEPQIGERYELGTAQVTVLGPCAAYEEDNDCSVIVKITHGSNSFLFTGDAEWTAERDCIHSGADLKADVLKLGHHGSNSSTGQDFLDMVRPSYVVISCGKENVYGHPHEEVLDRIKQMGCAVYRTDEQGTIVVKSDGRKLQWNQEPTKNRLPGVLPVVTPFVSAEPQEEVTYILNLNTRKFHKPNCPAVKEMKEKNKKESFDDRDTIIEQGFESCGRCKP